MNRNIGIDIGGTKVNIGIVDDCGNITDTLRLPTDSEKEPESFIREIVKNVHILLEKNHLCMDDIKFIGAGVPGTADVNTGMISYCPNLSWYDIPAGEYFKQYLGREIKIAQDSRNAALAELLFGAGRGYNNIVCVSVGTGIGGGIIIDRKIFCGGMNTAGEIGHTPIVKNGRECVCGNQGCLEKYASGNGMMELALERFPEKFQTLEKKCENLFDLAYKGDEEVLQFIDECVDNLAFGLANVVNLLSPEAIIISGGLCEHEKLFIAPLKEKIVRYGYYSWTHLKKLKVCRALLGSNAPMIGAAVMVQGM